MKITVIKSKHFLFALLVAFSVSCSTEDGQDGATGPAGADGQNGNANIISSDWIVAQYIGIKPTRSYFTIPAPGLTQEIMDTGIILVYGKQGPEVWNLPLLLPFTGETYSFVCSATGSITVFLDSSDGITPLPYEVSLEKFRYVLIPANMGGRSSLDFKNMPYNEVMDYLDLEY